MSAIKRATSRRSSKLTQSSNGYLIASLFVLAFLLLSAGFLSSSQGRKTVRVAKTKKTKRVAQPKKTTPVAASGDVVPAELRKGEGIYLVQNLRAVYAANPKLSNDEKQAVIRRLRINYGRVTAAGATWDASKATWN